MRMPGSSTHRLSRKCRRLSKHTLLHATPHACCVRQHPTVCRMLADPAAKRVRVTACVGVPRFRLSNRSESGPPWCARREPAHVHDAARPRRRHV